MIEDNLCLLKKSGRKRNGDVVEMKIDSVRMQPAVEDFMMWNRDGRVQVVKVARGLDWPNDVAISYHMYVARLKGRLISEASGDCEFVTCLIDVMMVFRRCC